MTGPITYRPDPPKPEDIRAQYGFVATLARQVPEINSLLDRATRENWTTDRFSMEVANTGWWKTTDNPTRQWIVQQVADPATARQEKQAGGQLVAAMGKELGFYGNVLGPQEAEDMWLYSRLHGFSERQTRAYMFGVLKSRTDGIHDISGEYGQVINQMRTLAGQYGYDVRDEGELRNWAGEVMGAGTGANTVDGWKSKMQSFAKVKYAAFADQIDAGQTVQDIAAPYVQAYREVLEQDPSKGFLDPTIDRALQSGAPSTPEQKVARGAVPLWEFKEGLRRDPRWGQTANAREAVGGTLTALGKMFGKVG